MLAASVMLRHVTDDPVRAVTLAWRALPAPLRGLACRSPDRTAGPPRCGARATAAARSPRWKRRPARLAAFSLAVDQPTVARSALARLSEHNAGPSPARGPARLPGGPPGRRGQRARRRARLARRPAAPVAAGRARRCSSRAPSACPPGRARAAAAARRDRRQGPRAAHRDRRAAVDQRRLHGQDPGDRARPARGRARPARRHQDRLPRHGRRDRRPDNRHRGRRARTTGCSRGSCPAGWTGLYQTHLRHAAAAHRRAAARRAARRLQLRQRGHRAGAARRDPAARSSTRCAGSGRTPGCRGTPATRDLKLQRPLPAHPGARDALHERRRPGGDAGRGDAGGDPRARRRPRTR